MSDTRLESPPRPSGLRGAVAAALPWPLLARFAGGGVLNTVFGYIVFVTAIGCGATVPAALLASTLTGILFNFQTSRRIVFQSREPGLLFRFTLVYLIVFAVNCAAIFLLEGLGLASAWAQLIMIGPMAILAFVCQRNFVFHERAKVA